MIVVAVIYFLFDSLLQAGFFKGIDNQSKMDLVTTIRDVWGPEDLDWDRENNMLYISSTNRWEKNRGNLQESDGIYFLKTDDESLIPQKMSVDLPGEFHPHGISFFTLNGTSFMYVVNHTTAYNSVELFEIDTDKLIHKETFKGGLLTSPNDVVGDEIGKFYVTNDHGNTTAKGKMVEDYLRMPYSFLLYYDGSAFKKAHKGMVYANGVQFSNDGSKVYTSHTIGKEVYVLDRKRETGMLILKHTVAFDSGLDNLDVDENGVVWVAAHPKLLDFQAHANDSTQNSPSQIFRMDFENGKYKIQKVYENDGSQISGSSVVVVKDNTAFVGCVFEDKILKMILN